MLKLSASTPETQHIIEPLVATRSNGTWNIIGQKLTFQGNSEEVFQEVSIDHEVRDESYQSPTDQLTQERERERTTSLRVSCYFPLCVITIITLHHIVTLYDIMLRIITGLLYYNCKHRNQPHNNSYNSDLRPHNNSDAKKKLNAIFFISLYVIYKLERNC